jgi:SPP1 gp7 family putative phage head morphogenesis protein
MSIEDAITRRMILVQRFADGNADVIEDRLQIIKERLTERLSRENDFVSGDIASRLISDINNILSIGFEDAGLELFDLLVDFAEDETAFNKLLMDAETTAIFAVPSRTNLVQTLATQAMAVPVGPSAITISEAIEQYSKKKTQEVIRVVTDGLLEGKTLPQISRAIRELIEIKQARQAKTLTRTATNATLNLARGSFFSSNTGIIEGYEWVSTLDGRTTLICAGRDGNVYKVGKGPLPPAHWGCRSTVVPIVRKDLLKFKLAGERPQVGASGPGVTSGNTTYQQWLSRQPASFQDEVLGPTRGKLFRAGSVRIDQFRDETGRTYTLEQLRDLMPLAFDKANID